MTGTKRKKTSCDAIKKLLVRNSFKVALITKCHIVIGVYGHYCADCCRIFIAIIVEILQHHQCLLSPESAVDSSSVRQQAVTDETDENIDELLKRILHLDSKYF